MRDKKALEIHAYKIAKPAASKQSRKTFAAILREEAPGNAFKLEAKARSASWIAKVEPEHSSKLYSIKHAALRQLFRIPDYAPVIREAWTTSHDFLLSVQLKRTKGLLHVPFNRLTADLQRTFGKWVIRHARGRVWRTPNKVPKISSNIGSSHIATSVR